VRVLIVEDEVPLATPILMLTARDAAEHRIAGLATGADDSLVKPFDFGELLALDRRSRPPRPTSSGPGTGPRDPPRAAAGEEVERPVKELHGARGRAPPERWSRASRRSHRSSPQPNRSTGRSAAPRIP
jgi:hypothetical protein